MSELAAQAEALALNITPHAMFCDIATERPGGTCSCHHRERSELVTPTVLAALRRVQAETREEDARLREHVQVYLAAEKELDAAREALGHARTDAERIARNPRVIAAANTAVRARLNVASRV